MRIDSSFKDYYDYISHQYGADPNVLYDRKALDVKGADCNSGFVSTLKNNVYTPYSDGIIRKMFWIVAGMRVIPFIEEIKAGDWNNLQQRYIGGIHRISPLSKANEHFCRLDYHQTKFNRQHKPINSVYEWPSDPRPEDLKQLIRFLQAPVFKLERAEHGELTVDERVPILKNYGIAAMIPAGQMWQEIYSTLINVLRKNPDKELPMVIENNDRIEAAGFDLKTSFRHPINPKPKK